MNIVEDGSDEVKDWKVSLVGRRMRMHRSQEKGGLALMPFASSWTLITARRRCAELNQVIETPTQIRDRAMKSLLSDQLSSSVAAPSASPLASGS